MRHRKRRSVYCCDVCRSCHRRLRRHRAWRVGVDVIRALLRLFRRPHDFGSLEPIQPRVTPDPDAVEALERRRAELSYRPEHGFLLDHTTGESA
jgi:hypothetical protein